MKTTIINDADIQRMINEYATADEGTGNFTTTKFSQGITGGMDLAQVEEWVANPEENQENLEQLALTLYNSDPTIFQMIDVASILPTLKYKVDTIVGGEVRDQEVVNEINMMMKKIYHREITRDILTQTMVAGTTCGIWLGNKRNPELFIFNDLKTVFPAYIKNNEWVLMLDFAWIDGLEENEREQFFETFKGVVTEKDYNKYVSGDDNIKYMELPTERTFCIRTHTAFRNQRLGTSWAIQTAKDVAHKKKLKDVETTISNKIINSVAVLTLGNDEFNDSKLQPRKKRLTFSAVKNALTGNSYGEGAMAVVGIPHWAKLEFPSLKVDGLEPAKFDNIDKTLNYASNGVGQLLSGDVNYSAGSLILDIIYRKIGTILEQIEDYVYQKMINNFILKKRDEFAYSIVYEKERPVDKKEKIDTLKVLNTQFGFGLQPLLNELGVDFETYIAQTLHEQVELDLPNKITPYKTSHTQSLKETGRPETDSPTESTQRGRDNDTNREV